MPELIVTSTAEWLALPEPTFPSLKSAQEKGSVYHLYKVGFFFIPPSEEQQAPVDAHSFGDRKVLPTAVIDFGGKKTLCRLPLELSEWASFCVSAAHSGQNVFPCEGEFGHLDGRTYVELL